MKFAHSHIRDCPSSREVYEKVKKTFHCSNNHFKVYFSLRSLAILYLLHTYYNACSDLEEPEVPQYSLYVTLFLGLADRGDAFTMFNSVFFFSLMQKVVEKDPCIPK